MSTFTIPNNRGEIRQVNSGDLFGELYETFNIDLSTSQGKIKTSKKLTPVLIEGTHIGTPSGFVDMLIWNGHYYVLTEDKGYRCSVNDDPTNPANWSESIVGSHDADLSSTAVIFDGQMRISLDTNIARWNGSVSYNDEWWTGDIGGTALTTAVPHVMITTNTAQETIWVTDGNVVRYYNSTAGHDSFTFQNYLIATCLAQGLSGNVWVGTFNETAGNAMVYELAQGETIATNAYPVNAQAVLAMWMKDNIPHIVTDKGEIQAFNGAGFTTVAEFPFKYSAKAIEGIRSGLIQDANRSRPIHPRGVKVHEDSVFISVTTKADLTETSYPVDVRSHSGIWEYNMKTGVLNHRFAFAHQSNDYGDMIQTFAYPLLIVDNDYTFLIAGGFDSVNSRDNVYMTTSDTPQGWFITPEITSDTVTDAYEALYHKAQTLRSGEEIVTQYRTSKRDTIKSTINWMTATTFTTTDDWSNVQEGELIRIVSGRAAGDYANITEITSSASTYTVTVDKAIGATGVSSNVYCDNFKKDTKTYTSEDGEWAKLGGYGTNPWIQFAIFLKGDIEYRQLIVKGTAKNET